MTVSWFFWMLVGFGGIGYGIGSSWRSPLDCFKNALCIICGAGILFVTGILGH